MSSDARPPGSPRAASAAHTAFGHDDDDLVLSLLTYRSEDSHTWDALLARPRRAAEWPELCVVVHGDGGNYMSGVPRVLAFELSRRGHPTLNINTRMANFGTAYGGGRLDLVPRDLSGALRRGRELGFERFVLIGHREGVAAVVHFQADRAPDDVVAIAGAAPVPSLPDATRARWDANGADPAFGWVAREAERVARGEREDDIVCVLRANGPSTSAADAEVWTYRTWWECHAAHAAHAVPSDRLAHVRVPTLIVEPDDAAGRRRGREFLDAADGNAGLQLIAAADADLGNAVPAVARTIEGWLAGAARGDRATHPPPPPAQGGTRHQLVTIVAEDGTAHDGLLHHDPQAEASRGGPRTAMLHMHGNQGNLTVGTLRFLPHPVVEAGVGMLVVETRLANASQLVGHAKLPDALLDLAGGVEWLLGEGYDRIILSGYSLGATLAVRMAAGNPPWLAGLVTFGADWSMPEATRTRMAALHAEPSYDQLVDLCREAGVDGPVGAPDDPLMVVRRAFGASTEPRFAGVYTARTWWASRGPEATDAEPGRHIAGVAAPILLVQGTADTIAAPVNAERLAEEARRGGNDRVRIASIKGVGHSFHGGEQRVADAVTCFLAELS